MPDCTYITECSFYHDLRDGMPLTAEFKKMLFCHKQSESCARYLYHYHKEITDVQKDLMPLLTNKAKEHIRNI